MVASQKENLARILEFQRQEKAHNFKGLAATVNIIAQEHVVERADISCLLRCAPDIEESHQISVIAVNVSENFDWRLQLFDQHGLGLEHLSDFINQLKHLLFLNVERTHHLDGLLAFSWCEQVFDEERVERLVVVLLNEGSLDVRSQLPGLFLQLVN